MDIYNSIKYTRGIGNIGTGDYLFLSTLTPKYELDDGSLGRYCLNKLVDKDGSIIYNGPYSSQFSGVRDIVANERMEGKTYDLYGREVSSPVPGSIYIRNGKKFVAE